MFIIAKLAENANAAFLFKNQTQSGIRDKLSHEKKFFMTENLAKLNNKY